jgi:hypothetical protein
VVLQFTYVFPSNPLYAEESKERPFAFAIDDRPDWWVADVHVFPIEAMTVGSHVHFGPALRMVRRRYEEMIRFLKGGSPEAQALLLPELRLIVAAFLPLTGWEVDFLSEFVDLYPPTVASSVCYCQGGYPPLLPLPRPLHPPPRCGLSRSDSL